MAQMGGRARGAIGAGPGRVNGTDGPSRPANSGDPGSPQNVDHTRIRLEWPGKGRVPVWHDDGQWRLADSDPVRRQYALTLVRRHAIGAGSFPESLVVEGDRLKAISVLKRMVPGQVKIVYADMPRIVLDDKTKAFQGESDRVWSTYLSVIREHLLSIKSLLARDGVVVVHSGDSEDGYARLVAAEIYGRQNQIGTIVWQRHYAPRNMRGMKEFTATHDPISVFAADKEALPPVALEREAEGYENRDEDPRGPWKAEHKGARTRREKSDFETNVPPYRWRLVSGNLPPGIWRVSPLAGVLWGNPTTAGKYRFKVEASDNKGAAVQASIELTIAKSGETEAVRGVPWLFVKKVGTSGRLRIVTRSLPEGVVGREYAAALEATGGDPYTGKKRPRSGRYWEFADYTLERELLHDNVSFGSDGNAIPHPKKRPPPGGVERVNLQSWWPARPAGEEGDEEAGILTGYTEDATKHLKKLLELGFIKESVTTAKPEPLLARLLDIFSRPGDLVLELFGESAAFSCVALKKGRRFAYLSGASGQEVRLLKACAIPRLEAVVSGKDTGHEDRGGEIRLRRDAYLAYGGGGAFAWLRVGESVAELRQGDEFPVLAAGLVRSAPKELMDAILTAEGFLPTADPAAMLDGVSVDGRRAAAILSPGEFLDHAKVSAISSVAEGYVRVDVYYFRSAEDFDPSVAARNLVFRRVPSDMSP